MMNLLVLMVTASSRHKFAITLTTAEITATKELVRIHQVRFRLSVLSFNTYM